ncbi:MAG: hypothetical protein U9R75_02220, partial [Candidatus Thermoplasmatota archaeon]|nr:hypothetical protein [Candidatus Thermoplasmatota archaeon]
MRSDGQINKIIKMTTDPDVSPCSGNTAKLLNTYFKIKKKFKRSGIEREQSETIRQFLARCLHEGKIRDLLLVRYMLKVERVFYYPIPISDEELKKQMKIFNDLKRSMKKWKKIPPIDRTKFNEALMFRPPMVGSLIEYEPGNDEASGKNRYDIREYLLEKYMKDETIPSVRIRQEDIDLVRIYLLEEQYEECACIVKSYIPSIPPDRSLFVRPTENPALFTYTAEIGVRIRDELNIDMGSVRDLLDEALLSSQILAMMDGRRYPLPDDIKIALLMLGPSALGILEKRIREIQ